VIQRNNSKTMIRKACLEVIHNEEAGPKEKLRAAALLEKLVKNAELARDRKRKSVKSGQKMTQSVTSGRMGDLLESPVQ